MINQCVLCCHICHRGRIIVHLGKGPIAAVYPVSESLIIGCHLTRMVGAKGDRIGYLAGKWGELGKATALELLVERIPPVRSHTCPWQVVGAVVVELEIEGRRSIVVFDILDRLIGEKVNDVVIMDVIFLTVVNNAIVVEISRMPFGEGHPMLISKGWP